MRAILPILGLLTSACFIALVDSASAQRLPQRRIQRAVGVPSPHWACPSEGTTLRFRPGVGRRHETTHKLGRCFRVLKQDKANPQKLWIDAVDAVIFAFFQKSALAPIVQRRHRLEPDIEANGKRVAESGVFVHPGTPVSKTQQLEQIFVESDTRKDRSQETASLVHVELPMGDIVARGWMPTSNLATTSRRRRKRRPHSGRRISIPGQVELLNRPLGDHLADIASTEEFITVTRLKEQDDHILISYLGEHAMVAGWIPASSATPPRQPNSDAELGLAKIADTKFWVAAGDEIYDRPNGQPVGVFDRDTEVAGRALKNGWIQFPLATDLGTLDLWSHALPK